MREISEDTYISINDFICGLNEEQTSAFFFRMKDKQPAIHSYMLQSIGIESSKYALVIGNFLFALIIRSYEYEYGEFPMIAQERITEYNSEKTKFITLELKRNSRNKTINGLKREAGQRVLIEFLELMTAKDSRTHASFTEDEKSRLKIAVYLTVIFLNEEMEKLK